MLNGKKLDDLSLEDQRAMMLNSKKLDDLSLEDQRAMSSLISEAQGKYKQAGLSASDARKRAAHEVGQLFNPPATGKEVLSKSGKFGAQCQRERQAHRRKKRVDNMEKHVNVNENAMTVVYERWATDNDFIASDQQLAHFTGKSRQTFGYARTRLLNAGFVIEQTDTGYMVTSRPQPEPEPEPEHTYSEAEVRKIVSNVIEDVLAQFNTKK